MRNPAILPYSLIFSSLLFAGISEPTAEHHLGHHYSYHEDPIPKHFVLVHGACLGAWSWYRLIPALQSFGYDVTAIDLAASGINPTPLNTIRSFSDYAKPLIDFMASLAPNERVILVGHSLGGVAISQAMELFPQKVSVGVFLTAIMPGPNLPFSLIFQQAFAPVATALDNKVFFDNGPNNPPTSFIFGPKYLSQVIYQFSPQQDAVLATTLARPVPVTSGDELVFTREKYGSVKRVFIIAELDKVLPKQTQEFMIQRNPPNRVTTVFGSDHLVMTSQPDQLLAQLLRIARDFS